MPRNGFSSVLESRAAAVAFEENGALDVPIKFLDANADLGLMHSGNLGPLGNGLGFSVYRQKNVPSGIGGLLFAGSPPAVARLVVSVVVDAIKASAFWRIAHVGMEVLKRPPSLAHLNSAPAVKRIRDFGRQFTPLPHLYPYPVNTGVAQTVAEVVCGGKVIFPAATRAGFSAQKLRARNMAHIPAIAPAYPSSHAKCSARRLKLDDGESSEYAPGKVNASSHAFNMSLGARVVKEVCCATQW